MHERRGTLVTVAMVLALAVGACGDGAVSADGVTVRDVWARASAATQSTGAVYFTVTAGVSGDALLGVSVPPEIAASAALHETSMAGPDMSGGMTMQPVASVHIEVGEIVTFEPGGYHVMLMDLAGPLESGSTFDLTLVFEHAGELTVTAEVRE